MTRHDVRRWTRARLPLLAATMLAGCSEDVTQPIGPTLANVSLTPSCRRGSVVFGSNPQTFSGRVGTEDCQRTGKTGRIEVYEVPAAWTDGGATSLVVELESTFDGVLVIFNRFGSLIAEVDVGFEGDVEAYTIGVSGAYYIGAEGFDATERGTYTLSVRRP